MDPITLTLMGASLGGGLLQSFGGKKQKSISPEWLKKHFGSEAVNEEMIKLFNQVLNSPMGQQLLGSAAEQGQQFERDTARGAAQAGFGPGGGADSGASIFSGAAAGGATNALQRGAKADIFQQVLPIAQALVQQRMGLAAGSEQNRLQSQTSPWQDFGAMLSQGANAGLAAGGVQQQTPKLPMNAINSVANAPIDVMGRGGIAGMTSQFPMRKPGFLSRLGSRFGLGRMAMSAQGA